MITTEEQLRESILNELSGTPGRNPLKREIYMSREMEQEIRTLGNEEQLEYLADLAMNHLRPYVPDGQNSREYYENRDDVVGDGILESGLIDRIEVKLNIQEVTFRQGLVIYFYIKDE